MKCICDRSAFAEALGVATAVIPTRTPKPILECIRLTAQDGVLTVTAYDQEVGLRCRITEVEINEPGETLVQGERIQAIVRESADETLALETGDDVLHIRGEDSHFQVYSRDLKEFPPVAELETEPDLVIRMGVLRGMIEKTLFAAARENTRYAINGVLWQQEDQNLLLVSTDGRRLAMCSGTFEKSVGDGIDAIVPTKAMGLFGRMHVDADAEVAVKLFPNQIIMRTDHATISSVLVEGRFPKYRDVLPRDLDKKIDLSRDSFLSAVRRAALLTNEESKGIRINISSEGLVLSSRAPEQGEATIRLAIEYTGESFEIGFNPAFLVDALKVCDDAIVFEASGPSKPGVLRCGSTFTYVIMPVNLS